MKPLFLYLRNFKGILANGLEELRLDLSGIPEGLVAITGRNGAGKTTIIDNLHPYRVMPFRCDGVLPSPTSFSFYEHCEGKAVKELFFEVDGKVYRSLLEIDAGRRKQTASLFEGDTELVCGGVREYDEVIQQIVGPSQFFFASIFRAQNARSIWEMGRKDIREVFSYFLGLEQIREYGERAREIWKELSRRRSALGESLKRLTGAGDEEIKQTREKLRNIEKEIGEIRAKLEPLKKQLAEKRKELSCCEHELGVLKGSVQRFREEVELLRREVSSLQQELAGVEKIRSLLKSREKTKRKLSLVQKEIEEISKEVGKYDQELKNLRESYRTLTGELKKSAEAEVLLKRYERYQALENKNVLCVLPCRELGDELALECPLAQDVLKRAGMSELPEFAKKSGGVVYPESVDTELVERGKREADTWKALVERRKDIEQELEDMKKKGQRVSSLLNEKAAELEKKRLEQAKLEKEIQQAEEAEKMMGEMSEKKKLLVEKTNRGKETKKKLAAAEDKLKKAEAQRARIEKEIRELEEALDSMLAKERELSAEQSRLLALIDEWEKSRKQMESVRKELQHIQKEEELWKELAEILSTDGIIRFEIEAAVDDIARHANYLLSYYSPDLPFTIRIDTVKELVTGGKRDTLEISVYDGRTGNVSSLRTALSGGEQVWIQDAIMRAIAIVGQERLGSPFKTIFSDERDGALDYERRVEFIRVKREVLRVGLFEREYFITQSRELWEECDHILDVEELTGCSVLRGLCL